MNQCQLCHNSNIFNAKFRSLLRCQRCGCSVHPRCLLLPDPADSSGTDDFVLDWECHLCQLKAVSGSKDAECAICGNNGGILRRTSNPMQVVHVECAVLAPREIVDLQKGEEGEICIYIDRKANSNVEAESKCSVCSKISGFGVSRCSVSSCSTAFHPSCGILSKADFVLNVCGSGQEISKSHPAASMNLYQWSPICSRHNSAAKPKTITDIFNTKFQPAVQFFLRVSDYVEAYFKSLEYGEPVSPPMLDCEGKEKSEHSTKQHPLFDKTSWAKGAKKRKICKNMIERSIKLNENIVPKSRNSFLSKDNLPSDDPSEIFNQKSNFHPFFSPSKSFKISENAAKSEGGSILVNNFCLIDFPVSNSHIGYWYLATSQTKTYKTCIPKDDFPVCDVILSCLEELQSENMCPKPKAYPKSRSKTAILAFVTEQLETLNFSVSETSLENIFRRCNSQFHSKSKAADMWVEKYSVEGKDDLLKNGTRQYEELCDWIEGWSKKSESWEWDSDSDFEEIYSGNLFKDGTRKALYLTGSVGSGKTSVLKAFVEDKGYKLFEINSSTKRTKKAFLDDFMEASQSLQIKRRSIADHESRDKKSKKRSKKSTKAKCSNDKSNFVKTIILLDEVDMVYDDEIGFEAGVQQLIQISRNPVILMGSKTSSLSQTLIGESIECTPPEISLSIGKLLIIALLEGGKNCTSISGKELSMLFKCLNMDIRKVLIQLQFLISSSNADLNLSSYGCNYPLLFFSIGVCPNSYMLFSNFLDCKQMSTISQWNYIPRVMRDIITPSQVHFNFTKKLATINSPQLLGDVSSFLDVLCWGDAFLDLEENMDSLSSILAFAEISKDMHLTALLLGYRNFSEAIGSSELNGWLFDQENIVNNHCGFLYEYFSMFNSHSDYICEILPVIREIAIIESLREPNAGLESRKRNSRSYFKYSFQEDELILLKDSSNIFQMEQ